jgi:hypothetical protein
LPFTGTLCHHFIGRYKAINGAEIIF